MLREEWVKSLLEEARGILNLPVIYISVDALGISPLEDKCIILLEAFSRSADLKFFKGIYKLTWPLFSWYSAKCLKETNFKSKAEDITTRFYSALCEYILRPGAKVPKDNFFGWCYTLIANLIAVESGKERETSEETEPSALSRIYPTESEAWMRFTKLSEKDRLEERVIEVLITGDADLTNIERETLSLYYGNGMSINELASKTGLNVQQTTQLLHISRSKVLHEVYRRENLRIGDSEKEERQ